MRPLAMTGVWIAGTADSVSVPPPNTLWPVSPSTPWRRLSLPTSQTIVLAPCASVWLTAGELPAVGPPHQATDSVGGEAAEILIADRPPVCPAGQPVARPPLRN